uniref:Reverse transcriptase domain-containing protein n=1 Tax=Caenorhabditis japonica TaxID=281687 RepID=A0A8R1IDT6_CAEJA
MELNIAPCKQDPVDHYLLSITSTQYSAYSSYTNYTTTITPFHKNVEVPITRGVRQGDPIVPNLLACLESVFSKLTWQHLRRDDHLPGIRMNGQNLTLLRFADDRMIQELVEMCEKLGLPINNKKTKVMRLCQQKLGQHNTTHASPVFQCATKFVG